MTADDGTPPETTDAVVHARADVWDRLVEDLLQNALESWRAGDLRGTVDVIGMTITAIGRRVSLQ